MYSAAKRATSQQVALRAGVSRTTVSFVLNGVVGMNISEATRVKVLSVAAELGYVPNAAAKMLVSGQTQTIGLVVSQAEHLQVDAFIPQILYALSSYSQEAGYRVLLETVRDVSKPDAYSHLVKGHHIDGLIVINSRSDDAQLPELIRRNYPLVLLGFPDWTQGSDNVYCVSTDGVGSAKIATKHLIDLGHRCIAHVTFSLENYFATQDRHQGYSLALEEAGLDYDEKLVARGNYSAESGFFAMQQILKHKPTAVFVGNDTVAVGVIAAIHQAGLRIPQDIALVGYDDIPIAAYLSPALTTIRVSALEHGQKSIAMLQKLMRGEPVTEGKIQCSSELIIRDSCGFTKHL
jgi:DNA-binding LacI/PurR family transcriptional regulator